MLLRVVIFAALIASALAVVQRNDVLQNAGLVGHCSRIATPAGKSGVWHECIAGKVTGMPGLSLSSCKRVSHSTERDVWRCPVELGSDRIRQ